MFHLLPFVMQGRVYFDDDGIRGGRRLFIYQMRYNQTGIIILLYLVVNI